MTAEERLRIDELVDKYRIDRYTRKDLGWHSDFSVRELWNDMTENGFDDIELEIECGYYDDHEIVAYGLRKKTYEELQKAVEVHESVMEKIAMEDKERARQIYEALKAKFEGEKK